MVFMCLWSYLNIDLLTLNILIDFCNHLRMFLIPFDNRVIQSCEIVSATKSVIQIHFLIIQVRTLVEEFSIYIIQLNCLSRAFKLVRM